MIRTCLAILFLVCSTATAAPQAGTLDESFGKNGLTTFLPENNASIGVRAIAIDAEDRIVLAGHSETPFQQLTDFILLRFDDTGDPDSVFGAFQQFNDSGYVLIPWGPSSYDESNGVAFQSDGQIVLSGTGDVTRYFVLGRFDEADGNFDCSFGDDSNSAVLGYPLVTKTNPTGMGRSQAMLVDDLDRILVVGIADGRLAAMRVLRDGDEFDTSFDGDGKLFLDEFISDFDRPVDVALLPSGEIIVAANNPQTGNQSGYLFRLSDTGTVLPFGPGQDNFSEIGPLTQTHVIRDLTIAKGRIYACGFSGDLSSGTNISSFVACFDFNGNLDTSFSDDGVAEFDVAGKNTYLTAIAVESNGRIVAGGSQANEGKFDYEPVVIRLKPGGLIDTSYGNAGSQLFVGISGFTDAGTIGGGDKFYLTGIYDGQFGIIRVNGGLDFIAGDVNGDGVINLLDVAPFVAAISGEYDAAADINCDGSVDLLDVDPFIELLDGK